MAQMLGALETTPAGYMINIMTCGFEENKQRDRGGELLQTRYVEPFTGATSAMVFTAILTTTGMECYKHSAAATAFSVLLALFFGLPIYTFTKISKAAIQKRIAIALTYICCTYYLEQALFEAIHDSFYRSLITLFLYIDCLSVLELILVSRVDHEDVLEVMEDNTSGKLSTTTWAAFSLLLSWRRVGTKWQVKTLETKSVPKTKTRFLLENTARVVVCFIILDLMEHAGSTDPELIKEGKETPFRLWILSLDDVLFRCAAIAAFGVIQYVWILMAVTFCAVIAVASGLSDHETWPDLFRPISTSFTVRRFWGQYWHQSLRPPLSGFSKVFWRDILKLEQGLVSKYVYFAGAFFISGVVHHLVSISAGVPAADFTTVIYFTVQAVGIGLEEAVQALAHSLNLGPTTRRIIGFVWVLFWLFITVPLWLYPQLRLANGSDYYKLLPFSLVDWCQS